ncbi:MAG: A24 family peptidase C-terminal domain-containing protein [Natronomonas sp.]
MPPLARAEVVSLLAGIATGPDLLRSIAVPVFGWAAYRDLKTRRVPNVVWLPLVVVGVVALLWDAVSVVGGFALEQRLFGIRVALSLGIVAPLGYIFWRIGGFGGADAKAIMTLALLFPTYPVYVVGESVYPVVGSEIGVFSLTILSNTVLLGLLYPVVLAGRNAAVGRVGLPMFVGRPVAVESVLEEHGRLLETPSGLTRRGLDLDALRMYLRWRGVSLSELRSDPERYRHPLPAAENDPGDGAIADGIETITDGGVTAEAGEAAIRPLDEWGVERFLDRHAAYGTTPEELRNGLDVLTTRESVWISPGIPFVIPMFFGLIVGVSYGDLLFGLLSALGLV